MKYLYITITLLFSFNLLAQEIDQAYLDSLPESMKEDVLQKNKITKDLEEPVYRRASTFLDKDMDSIKSDSYDFFGSQFFDTVQTSFMPINEPNFDSSYILDFGDVLDIQFTGQQDRSNSYNIARDGSISIKDIGKVFLSGLSLESAIKLIQKKVDEYFIGTEAFITLTSIRDITILVAGNAFNPGIYTLNGNSNILHALSIAGGIDNLGSYRNIELIRNGTVVETLDIYEVLAFGNQNFQQSLRSGDSIVVKKRGAVVSLVSGVIRPAKYEVKANETYKDIIEFANGFSKFADTKNINIKRYINGEISNIELNQSDLLKTQAFDNDHLYIKEFEFNSVVIEGAVNSPGSYLIKSGTTISELIESAGGYTKTAYPFGGYLENKKALQINQESKNRLYDSFMLNMINNSTLTQNQNMRLIIDQLKESSVTGRVIAEFDLDVINSNKILDTILEDGDRILIPNLTQQVYVHGEISNPGAVRYESMKGIKYYLQNAGDILDSADIDNMFIVHPNGETTNLAGNSRLSFLSAKEEKILIYPGSVIYIPKRSDLTNGLEIASVWAPILSSLALTITSLSVLSNN